jgi:hypothetical protein
VAARKRDKFAEEDRLVRAVNVQLIKNMVAWEALQEQGAGYAPELRLTFVYVAPDEARAAQLAAFLQGETDYELHVRRRGRVGGRRWFVAGATQAAPVSLETINAWTEWMIAAGAEHGPCTFDGWAPQQP